MVQAFINIDDHTNRVLNIVKAKYGLTNKSSAIELMASQYEEEILEPELRPEYVNKVKKIMRQDSVDVGNIEGLKYL
jgi:hypothetical protein